MVAIDLIDLKALIIIEAENAKETKNVFTKHYEYKDTRNNTETRVIIRGRLTFGIGSLDIERLERMD
jgi:hypothetical protein